MRAFASQKGPIVHLQPLALITARDARADVRCPAAGFFPRVPIVTFRVEQQ